MTPRIFTDPKDLSSFASPHSKPSHRIGSDPAGRSEVEYQRKLQLARRQSCVGATEERRSHRANVALKIHLIQNIERIDGPLDRRSVFPLLQPPALREPRVNVRSAGAPRCIAPETGRPIVRDSIPVVVKPGGDVVRRT